MHTGTKLFGPLLVAFALLAEPVQATDLKVAELRCEYVKKPLGIDSPAPRLFWQVSGATRGQRQTAYQVLAATSLKQLKRNQGDLWDSGKVSSEETTGIPYGGQSLKSSQQVFWKVRAWDKDGQASDWSEPSSWTMGVLAEADWQANWIGATAAATPPPGSRTLLLRREFTVKPGLRRALAHVCGLGCYELSLDGRKVGKALFPPGWTKYDKTCLYDTYDITPQLRAGRNAAGLVLGNGMYNVVGGRYTKFTGSFGPPKAILQLRLEYAERLERGHRHRCRLATDARSHHLRLRVRRGRL